MTRRQTGRLRALAWLVVLLAGLPTALVYYVGWPLPDHWPHRQEWQQWVADPLTRPVVIDMFAILGWLLWAVLLYTVLVAVTTRLRRIAQAASRLQLPPLPTTMQAAASGVLGAAVFGTATATAAPPAPTHPAPAAATIDPQPSTPSHPPPAATPNGPGPAAGQAPDSSSGSSRVVLPDGGWVTHHTAQAVAASAVVVWRQRRRRYLPRPPGRPARDDPDLAPLPATVTTIQHHLQPPIDDVPDQAQTGSTATVTTPALGGVTGPTLGEVAGRLLRPADLPPGGVGLTGPAASDAARGILVAALLASGHSDTPEPAVVTTTAVLDALLGAAARWHRDTAGLQVADSIQDALTIAEMAALRRAAPHPAAAEPTTGGGRPVTSMVLITDPATDQDTTHRLTLLLTLSTGLGITGVLLGPWPPGSTWHLEPDGTTAPAGTSGAAGVRLSVLGATATTDLLTVHREAHAPPGEPVAPRHTDPAPARADAGRPRPQQPAPAAATRVSDAARAVGGRPRLRLLGPPAVYPGTDPATDTTPLRFARGAALPILVFLALHPDGAAAAELSAALWPGQHSHATADRIYTTVSSMRSTFVRTVGAPVVIGGAGRYRLDTDRVEVDLWRLHAALRAATTAADSTDRADALRGVVEAYAGDLADGWAWPWLDPHREATRRHLVDAYVALAAHHNDPQGALVLLQAAVRVEPDNDELRRLLRHAHTTAAAAAEPTTT